MKISELMLDMATGDASAHDVAIQEAVGKVNVSCAIYEAAYKISALADEPSTAIIQEAAEVGLPTEKEDACGTACEAVNQELGAYLDVIAETAKKIKSSTDKELKLLATVGKKFGVSPNAKSNFTVAFANPFAKSVINDNKKQPISLGGNKFIKAKYSAKLAANYCKGMTKLLAAYGLSISDVFADPAIAAEYGKHTSNDTASTMNEVLSYVSDGDKLVKFDKLIEKDRHYTDTAKENDIASLVMSLYIIISVSDAIVSVAGKPADRKNAMAHVRELCGADCIDEKGKKKINTAMDTMGTDAKEYVENVTNITNAITKAFGDSTYALMEALNGAPATASE